MAWYHPLQCSFLGYLVRYFFLLIVSSGENGWWMDGSGVATIVEKNTKFTLKLELLAWQQWFVGSKPIVEILD